MPLWYELYCASLCLLVIALATWVEKNSNGK